MVHVLLLSPPPIFLSALTPASLPPRSSSPTAHLSASSPHASLSSKAFLAIEVQLLVLFCFGEHGHTPVILGFVFHSGYFLDAWEVFLFLAQLHG
jgi:hypothetical protein